MENTAEAGTIKEQIDAAFNAKDFTALCDLVFRNRVDVAAQYTADDLRKLLRGVVTDRMNIGYVETTFPVSESGKCVLPIRESIGRLERMLYLQPGKLAIHGAWGLAEVKRVDAFYRRITVDFRNRKGHQLSFQAACETLAPAPENHILVIQKADPDRIVKMIAEKPGDFVKLVLQSFGDMPIGRLEEVCAQNGFVKSANWKKFWEGARTELHRDKTVEIPTRRADPIHVKQSEETFGDGWLVAFSQKKDPKEILSSLCEFVSEKKVSALTPEVIPTISDRMAFALKAARNVDDALYARIAFKANELGLQEPDPKKSRNYLWEYDRYLDAARNLPARELANLVRFLTAEETVTVSNRTIMTKPELLSRIPDMCFSLLSAVLETFTSTEKVGDKEVSHIDADCEKACAELLRKPHAPATLVTYVLARYDAFRCCESFPALVVILTHGIALGEGKQNGETLKMQNVIRRLFADQKWLTGILAKLQPVDQALFFDRFQASIAWDPSTHHTIVVRMTKIVPDLNKRMVKKVAPKVIERITSFRSYEERKEAYKKLVTVDMPANTKRIESAKSYGDLSENAEYQYAKDEERALIQKQHIMQEELDAVKPVDFAYASTDEVNPGTIVEIAKADGSTVTYTILGEWDNDLDRNIIANITKLAKNMLGKKVGESFELPAADGSVSQATVKAIMPLTDEIKNWVKNA